jgi:hypothetical protein
MLLLSLGLALELNCRYPSSSDPAPETHNVDGNEGSQRKDDSGMRWVLTRQLYGQQGVARTRRAELKRDATRIAIYRSR